jgi:hypothetical protein
MNGKVVVVLWAKPNIPVTIIYVYSKTFHTQ